MRDQVTKWLQAETAKHRATGGTFGDAAEEVEVRVRDEEVDSFIAAGRNATTQGLDGQMNVLKMLIQAQSRQGVELSEEFLRKRLNALTKWMWGAVKSGQKLGGSPSGATSSVASGSDGGKPRENDMPPPMVSEAQRERVMGRSAGRDEGTGSPEEALDVDMEEVGLQKALEQSLKESQRPGGEGGTADKMAFANAKTAALNFAGMGLSNAVRVQTPNNLGGTHSADMLGRSERIPSIGAQPEFDSEELETPGYSSMAFGADGDEAYGPYAEQDWSDGMPPAVAQNAIVRQIWNGYKKASWKWIVENRGNLGFETAIEELLTKHPRAQEMLSVGGNQDKTWLISGEGAPAKWLRDLDWGHHCGSCCAWWMGPSIATAKGNEYPAVGGKCGICERRFEALHSVAMRRSGGGLSIEEKSEMLKVYAKIGTIKRGPPPPQMWSALVDFSKIHQMDPRAVAARMAERLASVGYSWEELEMMKPYEMFLILGLTAIDCVEGRLDLIDLIEQMGRELCNESGELKEGYVTRTGMASATRAVLGEADDRRDPRLPGGLREGFITRRPPRTYEEERQKTKRMVEYRRQRDRERRAMGDDMEESKDVEMEDQQYGWDKKMDKEAAILKASIQDGEPDDGKALFTINDEDDDGRGPPIVASLQWTDEDIEYEYGALEEFGPRRLCEVYGVDIAALRLKNMRPFSLANLESLLRSIFGEVKVADMLEGLSRAGAKETAARILITVQRYGGADLTMKQLLNVPESRVLPQARLTCMLLGTVRKKGDAPTHAEMKLHRFLYLKKQELEALGGDYGLGMREAAVFLRRKPAFAYQIPDKKARIGQEALADLAKYGNVWSEYLASQVDLTPTQWVDWNMDPKDQGDGVSRFNPRKYLEYVQAAANIAMADRTAQLLAEEGKAGKEGMIPGVNRVMWEEQHLKLFPNAKWVNALMNSSIRPGLYDDASLQRISALPANWRPEIRSALTFLGSLENVTMAMDQACKMLNKMPMFHPHLPYVFAMIVKIRNYLRPLFQAVQEYGLGTKAFELVDCPREWKQPFMSTAGERPDFFPRTLVEIIRAHASAIAVVGTNEEKASLAYSPVMDYQRTVSGEKNAGQMVAEQILEESIPDRCYRLVKVVEEQGEKVFLQLAVHPTEPVISSRNVIAVTGGFPRAFGMTEEQLSDLQTRFVKGEEGTLRNAVTECLNLSAEGKRNPRHPRIPSMLALIVEKRERRSQTACPGGISSLIWNRPYAVSTHFRAKSKR